MQVAALFMRALDNQGDAYLPYSFSGDWTDDEKETVESAISPHVPAKVDAMFNNWRFSKFASGGFMAKRVTWDMGIISTQTVSNLAQEIASYYAR